MESARWRELRSERAKRRGRCGEQVGSALPFKKAPLLGARASIFLLRSCSNLVKENAEPPKKPFSILSASGRESKKEERKQISTHRQRDGGQCVGQGGCRDRPLKGAAQHADATSRMPRSARTVDVRRGSTITFLLASVDERANRSRAFTVCDEASGALRKREILARPGQDIHKLRSVLMLISRRIRSLISSCALPRRKTRSFNRGHANDGSVGEAPRPARPAHMLPWRKLTILGRVVLVSARSAG